MDGFTALALCLEVLTIATATRASRVAEDFGGRDLIDEVTAIMARVEARGKPTLRDAKRLEEVALAVEKWPAEDW